MLFFTHVSSARLWLLLLLLLLWSLLLLQSRSSKRSRLVQPRVWILRRHLRYRWRQHPRLEVVLGSWISPRWWCFAIAMSSSVWMKEREQNQKPNQKPNQKLNQKQLLGKVQNKVGFKNFDFDKPGESMIRLRVDLVNQRQTKNIRKKKLVSPSSYLAKKVVPSKLQAA